MSDIDDNKNSLESENSSSVPNDVILKFNWGAFFFTWIWGLFHKKYITILILPIYLVLFCFSKNMAFLFLLIAGLYMGSKGNEWVWKSKIYQSPEQLHNSQRKWVCCAVAIFFLSQIVLSMIFVFFKSKLIDKELSGNDIKNTRTVNCYTTESGKCIKQIMGGSYINCSRTGDGLIHPENVNYCGKASKYEKDLWAGTKKLCENIGMRLATKEELFSICKNISNTEKSNLRLSNLSWTASEIDAENAYLINFAENCKMKTGSRNSHFVSSFAVCVKD